MMIFYPTLYLVCDYLSMLRMKSNHVNKLLMTHKTCSINYGHLADLQKTLPTTFHLIKYLLATFILFLSFQSVLVEYSGFSTKKAFHVANVLSALILEKKNSTFPFNHLGMKAVTFFDN